MSKRRLDSTLIALAILVSSSFATSPAAAATVYVTQYSTPGTVSVVDPVSGGVVSTILVGDGPTEVVLSPDRTRAYVANQISGTLSVIDTSIDAVVDTIVVGGEPVAIAITPDGHRAYVASRTSNVAVVDLSSHMVMGTVNVGVEPSGLAVTPDGTRVYVVNQTSNSVSVIEVATDTLIANVPVGQSPYKVVILPTGMKAYVTNSTSGSLSVISTVTNTVTATVAFGHAGGLRALAITPDGSRVYVPQEVIGGAVHVVDTVTDSLITSVTGFEIGSAAAISDDGQFLYINSFQADEIQVVNTATNTHTSAISLGFNPFWIAIGVSSQAIYLHGSGGTANPPTLFLDGNAPATMPAKFKDSPSLNFAAGNPWNEVGTWTAPLGLIDGLVNGFNSLRLWIGLKNSDDQGTQFDLRAEVYKNNGLIASGEARCITGVVRNPALAKEARIALGGSVPMSFDGTGDILRLKILTRIGTNPDDTKCAGPGGSHSSAVGLRLYFDGANRQSMFSAITSVTG